MLREKGCDSAHVFSADVVVVAVIQRVFAPSSWLFHKRTETWLVKASGLCWQGKNDFLTRYPQEEHDLDFAEKYGGTAV